MIAPIQLELDLSLKALHNLIFNGCRLVISGLLHVFIIGPTKVRRLAFLLSLLHFIGYEFLNLLSVHSPNLRLVVPAGFMIDLRLQTPIKRPLVKIFLIVNIDFAKTYSDTACI